ncbi:acetolactate synthase [Capsulimonas corticalis]|uniref:Acetolactate synthase n=1 Tax=Capsulimonas corticalis TaxID=2219043 RepID=A0A402CYA3_9BACT|nr:biosynthetic-type acetolactate synthase large subunit [Capsulimonas corticalis]BDI31447.1 acetolactate synthase [Capsulimonas corticalis]
MRVKGSRALLESLKREGVDTIFGYPGGAVIPIYDMIYQFPDIRHILVRHEQGAGHMAEGYALATGKVGVCLATSGPGATNLVTPLADAMMDSVPIVAITGQVRSNLIGTDAFQEADITGITMPITKHNWLVKDVNQLPEIVAEAFHVARSGRPGPVLIDIPRDVSDAEFEYTPVESVDIPTYKPTTRGHSVQIKRAAELIDQAKKPILYVGGGANHAYAFNEVRELAEKINTPVTTTLKGLGAFPETHPLSLGMLGMHGTAYANYAVSECDLLIAVGARFDDRVTGKVAEWVPNAKIIHIDIDPAEIGKVLLADVPIVGDVKAILTELNKVVKGKQHPEWVSQINKLKQDFPLHYPNDGVLHGQYVIEQIGEVSNHDAICVTDVGQHQMWAAQFFKCERPRQFVTSGGLGTMGFGLPAAIGAQFGAPDKPVFCVTGDGSIQMCIQELMVATIYKLPIKICILNNQFLGMVRQWQELFHENRYSSVDLEASPDFVKLAEAYGAHAIRCFKPSGVRAALEEAMSITDRPTVLDFRISKEENVYPMIPSGGTIHQMVVQRPPDMVPLDSYIASETYMGEDDQATQEEKETVPVPRAK